jgi:hypothetical protein
MEVAMAVGLRMKFPGGTQQQYDATHAHLNTESDPPQGLIFHSAGPIEGGWGIIEFWESRDAFDRFVTERLQRTIGELGSQALSGPPDIKEFPVYHFTKS